MVTAVYHVHYTDLCHAFLVVAQLILHKIEISSGVTFYTSILHVLLYHIIYHIDSHIRLNLPHLPSPYVCTNATCIWNKNLIGP